jgi:predicted nucleic acid-binding protein
MGESKESVLDTNILMREKTGLTTILNVIEYPRILKEDIQVLWPSREDFILSIELMESLLDVGKPVPAIDIIIASMCINRNLRLISKDSHFVYIKKIDHRLKVEIK